MGALGCGRIREVRGCRALAQLVNPVLDDISEHAAKDKGSAPYRYAAIRYGKLANDLKKFDIGIPRFEKSVEDLGAAMKEASAHSGNLAEALEKRDAVLAGSARRDLAHAARLQKTLAARIESDCGGT
jgi:hypothetical protein